MNRLAKISSILFITKQLICSTSESPAELAFVQTFQYNANNPIEDRITYAKLKNINAYTFSVFDGHGGDFVAEFAATNLNNYLDKRFEKNNTLKLSL